VTGRLQDDSGLRADFEQLRKLDAARGSSFARSWSAANRRASTSVDRRPARLVFSVAALAAVLAVMLALPGPRSRQELRPPIAEIPGSGDLIARWTAPSDVLLATSDRELWRGAPRLGEPLGDWNDPGDMEQQR
jgi:hypothetical protein